MQRMPGLVLTVACSTLLQLGLAPLVPAAAAENPFIAGTTPDQRPQGAPKITQFSQDPQEKALALKGVTAPYPPSLGFVEHQEAWYTPISRRGMLPPYDLRGLHEEGTD